jgi:formyltetrahydrofolate-dependent phosphoribosylglycinamide formyltransferase
LRPYRKAGRSREEYDADLARKMSAYPVDLVVQAGWMHILSNAFLRHYPGRVLNIHPALPGMFPGMHAIERAYEAFRKGEITQTGVMVHAVPDEGVDVGPVILQEVVPIYPHDTLEDLEARVHAVEHRIYVQAIAKVLGLVEEQSENA